MYKVICLETPRHKLGAESKEEPELWTDVTSNKLLLSRRTAAQGRLQNGVLHLLFYIPLISILNI